MKLSRSLQPTLNALMLACVHTDEAVRRQVAIHYQILPYGLPFFSRKGRDPTCPKRHHRCGPSNLFLASLQNCGRIASFFKHCSIRTKVASGKLLSSKGVLSIRSLVASTAAPPRKSTLRISAPNTEYQSFIQRNIAR